MGRGDYRLQKPHYFQSFHDFFMFGIVIMIISVDLDRSVSCNHSPQKEKEAIHFPCGCLVYPIRLTGLYTVTIQGNTW